MVVDSSSLLINLYGNYCDGTQTALVGHPTLDEVRIASLSLYDSQYSENEIGFINPMESKWWLAMAEFMDQELSPIFKSSLPETHYLFGRLRSFKRHTQQ